MKLATWNVNSVRARKERVWAWLDAHAPDVLCLQETKVVDDAFPLDELGERGYDAAVHGQKTYNGVAILSRLPLADIARGFDDGEPDEQARLVAATVGGIRVISAYVPNGKEVGHEKYQYKLAWMERLHAFLARTCDPDQPVFLCGDFNVAPEDRDIWDPALWEGKILCSDAERAALQKIVDWGFVDAFRLHHEEGGLYSWWDYRQLAFPKGRGLRIDFAFITRPLADRCSDAVIDRDARKGKQPSDHAPVVVTLSD
jgi:exodeoxyribonuclease-3